MTRITSSSNPEDLSMTMVAEFDAAPERLWNLGRTRASSSAGGVRRLTR
jgi:hypothetical protein